MNFRKKVVVLAALAVALTSLVGLGVLYASSAVPESPHYNYSECTSCHSDKIDLHADAGSLVSSDCIGCHGNRSDDVVYDAAEGQYFNGPHKLHLASEQLSFECTSCHIEIDLREASAETVRRQVSMDCAECHNPFPASMRPEWATQNCATCHTDWQSDHASKPYINNENIDSADCIGCHGGRAWYLNNAASLKLTKVSNFWASWDDYVAKHLSVTFALENTGTSGANSTSLIYVSNSNGVGTVTPLPLGVGTLAVSGSASFTVVYSIPDGITSFRSSLYAQATNDDDEVQYWPSSPPSS